MLPIGYKETPSFSGNICKKIMRIMNIHKHEAKHLYQDKVFFGSFLLNQMIYSDDPMLILMRTSVEIKENDFQMPEEALSDFFLHFLLDLIFQNQSNFNSICSIITVLIHILKRLKKQVIIVSEHYQNARDGIIDLLKCYSPELLNEFPEFQSQIVELCAIIVSEDKNFRVFLVSTGIFTTLSGLFVINDQMFDFTKIMKFIKNMIKCDCINQDSNELIFKITNLITSDEFYYRYKAIKFIIYIIKKGIFKEHDVEIALEKVNIALLIDDKKDIYTFDIICKFYLTITQLEYSIIESFIQGENIVTLLKNLEKIQYIPGKFKYIDMMIEHYISLYPFILLENGFLQQYVYIDNDNIIIKQTKLLFLSQFFENQEIAQIISTNFPISQFNHICEILLTRSEFGYSFVCMIEIIILANFTQDFLANCIIKDIIDEILTEQGSYEEFLILENLCNIIASIEVK